MSAAPLLLGVAFPFLMAYAAASDLLTMRISNRVTGFVVAGFVLYAPVSGMALEELAWHVAAGALTLVVTFVMFARGWVGGGDAKLAAGTALWLGIGHLADYLVVASILGGALTLAILYARTFPMPAVTARLPFAVHLHDTKTGIPYGIALAAAALIVMPGAAGWERLALM
ncbi:prepilin peptidase CpaA [Methylorubrum rhodinum]|uniref:Prepilin peptidase CpaA n=2 Tax=Methylorubrum rhodinum TaxID=29428 RepID=A0A840ZPY7_9HYPH|nr:prepilin peptidase CpaA [Methylorubrum rhodinum]